jgi:hypothetical protein
MGIMAYLSISVVASIGADPNYYRPQSWEGPTETDLVTCATMADELNATYAALDKAGKMADFREATCVITLVKGRDGSVTPEAAPTAHKVSYRF